SEYGLVAETMETPPDRSWVAFTLRAAARFHDGSPMTVEDVIWTFDTLRTRGHPVYRSYYAHVARVEKVGPRTVRFTFKGSENRELPVIVGQLPVLSRAYWAGRDFARTTLEPPLGSGPYRVESLEPGRSITYRRVMDYWAAALPVNVGRFNFDTIRYDYYRDGTVALEAFKGGAYDVRSENSSKNWATAYDVPAVDGPRRSPTEPRPRARAPEAGGLGRARHAAGECRDGTAADVRDPHRRPDLGAHHVALREEPRAPRRRGARAHGGLGAVRVPDEAVRLRHDGGRLRAVTFAGKRAGQLLGLRLRRHAGHPQPGRRARSGGGPADRPRDRRPRPAGAGGAHARARPCAAVGSLRHPALAHHGVPRRLLESLRP